MSSLGRVRSLCQVDPNIMFAPSNATIAASADEIYAALASASAPLTGAWAKLKRARRIGIKFSGGRPADMAVRYEGRLLDFTSEEVVRATLRLLREQTSADLVCLETSVHKKTHRPPSQVRLYVSARIARVRCAFLRRR